MVRNIKIYNNFNIDNKYKNCLLLIGNFDGLHLGHQRLFNFAKKYKKKYKLKIGVITFDPIPKMFFNKSIKNYRISNFDQKKKYFKKYQVDFIINKKFNKIFSKIKSYDFIEKILYKKIKAKFIFVSDNFRFGNKREGDVKLLKSFEKKYDYKIVNPKPSKVNKRIISSTLIRKLIFLGKIKTANKYLNRNWSIEGTVELGRKMGKKIGFPTCNISIGDYVLAKPGVYEVKVLVGKSSKYLKGIANLGYRPTFNQKKILLEVNIFNFSGNLYNKKLTVEFKNFIRGEKKFNNVDELKKQIKLDIKRINKI